MQLPEGWKLKLPDWQPHKGSYDALKAKTSLGDFIIDWKSWKEYPVYDLWLEDKHIGSYFSLVEAQAAQLTYVADIIAGLLVKDS